MPPVCRLAAALALSASLLAGPGCTTHAGNGAAIAGTSAAPAPADAPGALPAGTRVLRDVAYGDDPGQRYDVYLPAGAHHAPAIVLVHGGSWAFGDRDHPGLIPAKAAYWLPKGYALISVDYRLAPDATPLQQVQDVAAAYASVQRAAAGWGLDRTRFALMGHSAGAHLVAVLAAAPDLLDASAVARPRAAVLLDSAAYDVEALMQGPHPRLYDRAFGADPAAWKAVSPYARLDRRSLPMFAVCSTRHLMGACAQARRFAHNARALGATVEVLPQDLSHMQINRMLGEPSAYTEEVAGFLRAHGL